MEHPQSQLIKLSRLIPSSRRAAANVSAAAVFLTTANVHAPTRLLTVSPSFPVSLQQPINTTLLSVLHKHFFSFFTF